MFNFMRYNTKNKINKNNSIAAEYQTLINALCKIK